jgi:hypothetical protein
MFVVEKSVITEGVQNVCDQYKFAGIELYYRHIWQ